MFSSKNAKQKIVLGLRAGLKIAVPIVIIVVLFTSMTATSSLAAGRPPTATPSNPTPTPTGNGCTSTADCLSKMTLDEKIGQMTQANKNALTTPSDITTYYLGSLLSGGGEGPNGSGGTATEWANMYDNFQSYALQTRLKIPLIYGVDAVHGHNNVYGAVIFPHHIGMGATRDAA
ncbi:MAG TPA: glycoside hydrolase family 3 N-terminal domain-containing protein, partial [Anaerolineales bacterium]